MYEVAATGRQERVPRRGDMLSRPSFFPAIHWGVYLGPYGSLAHAVLDIQKSAANPTVAHVRLCSWEEFADGKSVTLHPVQGANVAAILARAQRLLAARTVSYDLLGWGSGRVNCEHVSKWVATGVVTSSQAEAGTAAIVGVGAVAAVALVAVILSDKDKDDEA